jgi:hypothetical protein
MNQLIKIFFIYDNFYLGVKVITIIFILVFHLNLYNNNYKMNFYKSFQVFILASLFCFCFSINDEIAKEILLNLRVEPGFTVTFCKNTLFSPSNPACTREYLFYL